MESVFAFAFVNATRALTKAGDPTKQEQDPFCSSFRAFMPWPTWSMLCGSWTVWLMSRQTGREKQSACS